MLTKVGVEMQTLSQSTVAEIASRTDIRPTKRRRQTVDYTKSAAGGGEGGDAVTRDVLRGAEIAGPVK